MPTRFLCHPRLVTTIYDITFLIHDIAQVIGEYSVTFCSCGQRSFDFSYTNDMIEGLNGTISKLISGPSERIGIDDVYWYGDISHMPFSHRHEYVLGRIGLDYIFRIVKGIQGTWIVSNNLHALFSILSPVEFSHFLAKQHLYEEYEFNY